MRAQRRILSLSLTAIMAENFISTYFNWLRRFSGYLVFLGETCFFGFGVKGGDDFIRFTLMYIEFPPEGALGLGSRARREHERT